MVDAAVDSCLAHGYEATTVEQIAEAVEVSTRTFSRYFASKDAVFIAVIDDLAGAITDELQTQPSDLGPMESLRAAHVAVLTRIAERRPVAGLTAERIVVILQIVASSESLRHATVDYRSPAAMAILADRMGVAPDDKRLALAVSLFATTIVNACTDVAAGDPDVPLGPTFVTDRLERALTDLAQFTAELRLP
ncbi:hypothetical protein B1790_29070 [Mycobacterium sp. AT1]|nr:hypothetical protein B1790_29070 [Mycobacterium sp. AT1]